MLWAKRAAAAVLAALVVFGLAIVGGGLIPANAGWREPARGVAVFVRTNGVHTWIMVPTVTRWFDWRPYAPPAHIADPRQAGNYLAIGYGNREFYLNTPTWADLSVSTTLAAAVGGGATLVHVDHETDPTEDKWQQRLVLRPDEYRRLATAISASFRLGRDGRPILVPGRGYDSSDAFYEAIGPYDLFHTCNAWTGARLRAAGVRTGVWTPLPQSIMWRL